MDLHLERLKESLESAVEGMSSQELSWHPPGKWCATQVLEHLYLTYTGTIKGFEKVMANGRPLASRASLSQRIRTLVVVGFGHMPAGVKAPVIAEPRGLPPHKVRKEFGAMIVAMDAIIAQCEERFGRRIRVLDHPILGPLNTSQWRKLHLVHGRHHQKQLMSLRERAASQTGSK